MTEAIDLAPARAPAPVLEAANVARPVAVPGKTSLKEPAPVAAIAPARRIEEPAALPKPREPVLDVATLKTRLRDTPAIGLLAKLSLRSQMDELLASFRAHYESRPLSSAAALRKSYDALVMKVLDLLQEGDPSLAGSISSSREAIWGILADRERFGLLQ